MREKKQKPLRAYILAGLGKVWMWWPPRNEAKKRAKHPSKKGWYICELCHAEREKVDVDHITPCIRPADGFVSWDDYIKSRFVEDPKQLQVICRDCHKRKSKEENAQRRKK